MREESVSGSPDGCFRRPGIVRASSSAVLAVSLLVAAYTALRQSRLANLWFDEAFTLVWARAPWGAFWTLARRDSGNGVGLALLLRALDWMTPGSEVRLIVFEMVPIIAWIGLIAVVYRCFSLEGHRLWGSATCLSMTLTATYQRYATEIRPYPLAALVVSLLVLLSLDPVVTSHRGRWNWLTLVLLVAAPFIHPLLVPLSVYFAVVLSKRAEGLWRRLLVAAGLGSAALLTLMTLTNPRGDEQLFWLRSGGLRMVFADLVGWLDANGVVSTVPPTVAGAALGKLMSIGTVLLLGWGGWYLTTRRSVAPSSPPQTLFVKALAPLLVEVAVISGWSVLGSHNYVLTAYRYLYPVLPLWTIVSSCALLGLVTYCREEIRRFGSDGLFLCRAGSPLLPKTVTLLVALIIAVAVATSVRSTLLRTSRTVRDVLSSSPPNDRSYLAEDLIKELRTLPEVARPGLRIGLTAEDFSFIELMAARQIGRLPLPDGVAMREPFDTCVPMATGLRGAPSVRINAPVSIWGDVFTSTRPEADVWVVLNAGFCVDRKVAKLQGRKILLSYDRTHRSFAVERRSS